MSRYRVGVHIVPRKGLLDPQGKAVSDALHALGFSDVEDTRIGRHIVLDVKADSAAEAERQKAAGVFGEETVVTLASLSGITRRRGMPSADADVLTDQRVELLKSAAATFTRYGDELATLTRPILAERLINGNLEVPDWLNADGSDRGQTPTYWEEIRFAERDAGNAFRYLHLQVFDPLAGELGALRSRLVPGSTQFLLVVLLVLLVVGAIWPMAELSAHHSSSKALILVGFSVLSVLVIGTLAWETVRLRRAANLSLDSF